MVAVLLSNEWVVVTHDPATKIVVYRRTALPFDHIVTYQKMVDAVIQALTALNRREHGILVDLREAPMRSDDKSDAIAKRFREDVVTGFGKSAVLVRTHVGKLQITRHATEDGSVRAPFVDEREAWRHLLEP